MVPEEIGCCGAYCGACRDIQKACKGCKPGYLDGSRELSPSEVQDEEMLFDRGRIACGDCEEYESCESIESFLTHPGYKIRRVQAGSGVHPRP